MGAPLSKAEDESEIHRSSGSLRRSPKERRSYQSKTNQIEGTSKIVGNLKIEIDIFQGDRTSSRYKEFQKILSTLAGDLQGIKNATKKQHNRDKCDEVLGEIQNCLQRLENKVVFNEHHDRTLDLGAVESHSFINHSFEQILPTPEETSSSDQAKNRQPKFESIKSLDAIRQETLKLEKDIKTAISLEDTSQFVIYENKIKILYTDLELISVAAHTPLSERKASIGKKLIRCNNQIKRFKNNLEINEKNKKAAEQSQKIVEDNETQETGSIVAIKNIERQIQQLKEEAKNFQGTSRDSSYVELDQDLRMLWAQLSGIPEPNEQIKRSKAEAIREIQHVLKDFSRGSKKRESQLSEAVSISSTIDQEAQQKQLLGQVEEFQNHWSQLNYNLDASLFDRGDKSKDVIEIFRKITEGMNKKIIELSMMMEKRKSNISLVIVKLIDNPHDAEKYNVNLIPGTTLYEPPDLLQEQMRNQEVVETEIRVQPSVKIIGEMQRVCTEAKVLLQQIRQSACKKDDVEYKIFETKLQQCRSTLDSIQCNKRTDTIDSTRKRASKIINEAISVLESKSSTSAAIRSSKSQEVMDIDLEIQYLLQQIKNYTGVTRDKQYEKIKKSLLDCSGRLVDVHASKQDSIQQIQQYHQELERKLAENQAMVRISEKNAEIKRHASNDLKGIIENVQKLKLQIERFTGVYEGLLYRQIEGKLKIYLDQLNGIQSSGDDKLDNAKGQTKQKIEKYLNILESKSTKTSVIENLETPPKEEPAASPAQQVIYRLKVQRQSRIVDPDSPHCQINSLRDKLVQVKDQTENFLGKYRDPKYFEIEKELLECWQELRNIDDRGHGSVVLSKEQYGDYIEKLLDYFKQKAQSQDEQLSFEIVDPLEELARVQKSEEELKEKVEKFQGTVKESTYKDLEQALTLVMKELENINVGNVAHVREQKRKLAEELQNCKDLLSEKATNRQEMLESERDRTQLGIIDRIIRELGGISKEVDAFVGIKNDRKYCQLDEVLIRMTIELDDIENSTNADIKNGKNKAVKEIQRNMNLLSLRALSKHEDFLVSQV